MTISEINKEGKEILKKYKEVLKSSDKALWKTTINCLRAKIGELEYTINMNADNPETTETIKLSYAYKSALRQIINSFGKKFIAPKYQ